MWNSHKIFTQVLIATRTTMMNLKSLKLYLILTMQCETDGGRSRLLAESSFMYECVCVCGFSSDRIEFSVFETTATRFWFAGLGYHTPYRWCDVTVSRFATEPTEEGERRRCVQWKMQGGNWKMHWMGRFEYRIFFFKFIVPTFFVASIFFLALSLHFTIHSLRFCQFL